MKLYSAATRYPYTAELWDAYNVAGQNDLEGNPIRYFYKRAMVKLNLSNDPERLRLEIFSDVPFPYLSQLRKIVDSYGEELIIDGIVQVNTIAPMINSLGKREDYHMFGGLVYAGDYKYEFQEDKPFGAL